MAEMPRRLRLLVATGLVVAGILAAPAASADEPAIEVIEVSGIIDSALLSFLTGSVERAAANGREVAIIQINAPAVTATRAELEAAAAVLADPPLPVVAWLGPAPARAGGGAAQLLTFVPLRFAAPGSYLQHWSPAIAGATGDLVTRPAAITERFEVTAPVPDVVDELVPSIRQLVQEIDGRAVIVRGGERTLHTITTTDGGVTTIPVSFRKPGFLHRFTHLAAGPEAAFFFLVAGLTMAAFEFYAIGPGLAAGVAALSLLLAGFGLSSFPVRGWALGTAIAGVAILTAGYQMGGVLALTLAGTAALVVAGLNLSAAEPQLVPGIPGIVLGVAAVLFFYLLAMPTVGRARFSTRTIGRDHLVGRRGRAATDFGPEGVVEIDGGRWPATSHREAGIKIGDAVTVVAVQGDRLEVLREREN
jgi:membrane-bound ClpP family serine protease